MKKSDLMGTTICVVLTLVAIALTIPIAECGVNDDWSYTKTAFDLAQTGRLVYNGWAAAMLGAQAYWGALFVKLFGYSFLSVRLSTAPLAAGCAALLYSLHRRADLPPRIAVFGTLTITLSPLFVPWAASFMTDVPSLFFFLASLYCYVRVDDTLNADDAHDAPRQIHLLKWLSLATTAGFLSGTVRQVYWIVPILVPLFFLMRHRKNPHFRSSLFPFAISWVLVWLSIIVISIWFNDQPYAIHEKVSSGVLTLFQAQAPRLLLQQAARMLLTVGAVIFPVLVVAPLAYHSWSAEKRTSGALWGSVLIIAALGSFFTVRLLGQSWDFPLLQGTFSRTPFMLATAPIALKSVKYTLPVGIGRLFSICVMMLIYGSIALKFFTLLRRREKAAMGVSFAHLSVVPFLFGIFASAYLPVLLLKSLVPEAFGVLDRYLLPLLPLGTVVLLVMIHKGTGRDKLPLYAWLVLALFAFYGIAQTHDYFVQLRTRLAVTGELERRGIPRTRIMAGFEYDSWTQISMTGCYNDPRVQKPKGVYVPSAISPGFDTMYSFYRYTPVVQPDYVVALSRHQQLFDTDFPDTEFSCWLKPRHRRIVVQVRDQSLAAVRSLSQRPALTCPNEIQQ